MVAVATGLREELPADKESRPSDQPLADRFLESPIETAGVPDRCETRLQRVFDLARDPECDHGRGDRYLLERIEVETGEMDVGVEQAGHQGAALAIDDAGVPGAGRPARCTDPP